MDLKSLPTSEAAAVLVCAPCSLTHVA
ncbi:hypothetical protein L195_g064728, partial [Trifolium pratense]